MSRPPVRTKRNFRVCLALLALAALGACTTGSQTRTEAVTRSTASYTEQMRNCLLVIYNTPTFEPAKRRVPLDFLQATLEQETDPSMAKDPEIAAVLLVQPQTQACRQTFLDQINAATPSLVPIYALIMTMSESSMAEVLQKKKSWGDHVRDVKELYRRGALDITEENKKIGSGLSTDAKAVEARRLAAENALTEYQLVEKSFATIRRPVFTK